MTTAFPALGTTAEIVVTDPARLGQAVALLQEELAAIDAACSRFRADSEISRLHEAAGRQVRVSPLLAEALAVAFRAARLTDGLVDPTVGEAVRTLGYDRDFASVAADRDMVSAFSGEPGSAADRYAGGGPPAERVGGALRCEPDFDSDRHPAPSSSAESAAPVPVPVPGWHRVLFDPVRRLGSSSSRGVCTSTSARPRRRSPPIGRPAGSTPSSAAGRW